MKTLVIGSTHRLRFTIKKNGVVWDLTGATVTVLIYLKYETATPSTYTATIEDAAAGTVYYDLDTDDLGGEEDDHAWIQIRLVQGSINSKSTKIEVLLAA